MGTEPGPRSPVVAVEDFGSTDAAQPMMEVLTESSDEECRASVRGACSLQWSKARRFVPRATKADVCDSKLEIVDYCSVEISGQFSEKTSVDFSRR